MKSFFITIEGVPEKNVADALWDDIKEYKVNLTVLDKNSYLYGKATDMVLNYLLDRVSKLGFVMVAERG